jgi:hypothetical protein
MTGGEAAVLLRERAGLYERNANAALNDIWPCPHKVGPATRCGALVPYYSISRILERLADEIENTAPAEDGSWPGRPRHESAP